MSSLSPEAERLQARLRERYIDSLPDKRAAIDAAWQRVRSCGWRDRDVASLRNLAHRLAGSAGSYGLDALGLAACELDASLASAVDDAQRGTIETRVSTLLGEFSEAIQRKT